MTLPFEPKTVKLKAPILVKGGSRDVFSCDPLLAGSTYPVNTLTVSVETRTVHIQGNGAHALVPFENVSHFLPGAQLVVPAPQPRPAAVKKVAVQPTPEEVAASRLAARVAESARVDAAIKEEEKKQRSKRKPSVDA
jgi:hypothetical protein